MKLVSQLKRVARSGAVRAGLRADPALVPTPTQEMFLRWNAERLGISPDESRRRYLESWRAIAGGHSGPGYRAFNDTSYRLFQVFFDDRRAESFEAYRMHARMHFLRMLSYAEPAWSDDDIIVRTLLDRGRAEILDFGCGLAQFSRSLATYLSKRDVPAHLYLADIPTLRADFLVWLGKQSPVPISFLACTPESPVPELPPCDLCVATDFFEHVHDPVGYFEKLHDSLRSGGLMYVDVADHREEFMHVSPDLARLRERIQALGYRERIPQQLFSKP
jgi:SAM-dependent methyltransferase